MIQTYPKKRLEIVVDAAAEARVVSLVEKAGAKGYTIVPGARGKGHRGVRRGHDIFTEGQNVVFVVVARQEVVDRIMPPLVALFEEFAGIATVGDVLVARDDHF